jgi:hypothetical protein
LSFMFLIVMSGLFARTSLSICLIPQYCYIFMLTYWLRCVYQFSVVSVPNVLKSMTWDRQLYFPSEGRRAADFITLKIQRPRPGLNPRTLGPMASTLTTRPPRQKWWYDSDINAHACNTEVNFHMCVQTHGTLLFTDPRFLLWYILVSDVNNR